LKAEPCALLITGAPTRTRRIRYGIIPGPKIREKVTLKRNT